MIKKQIEITPEQERLLNLGSICQRTSFNRKV